MKSTAAAEDKHKSTTASSGNDGGHSTAGTAVSLTIENEENET